VLNNKIHTRDNLSKRRHVDDKTCIVCAKLETIWNICSLTVLWLSRLGLNLLRCSAFLLVLILSLLPDGGSAMTKMECLTFSTLLSLVFVDPKE
jgi:hypothetical protein